MTDPTIVPADATALAAEVFRRDRARVRVLAALTIGLWILAGLLIPAILLPFAAKVIMTMDQLDRAVQASGAGGGGQPLTANDLVTALDPLLRGSLKVTMGAFAFAILAAVLASITSVALALTIRRATLRQVSANLAQISEQLRQLRPSGGGAAA
jgi:predicted Co/Zn/Cd cation transporter (cation efflux family)